jgi:hypothetical protein
MERAAGYSESSELTHLIEQLRERLAMAEPQVPAGELEQVLSRLVIRNQRLRVLHRLTRKVGLNTHVNEHISVMRSMLEQLDAQLIHELPSLLERMTPPR